MTETTTKDIIIFDLDGTLANGDHRVHHILKQPKDWRSFFAECERDKPIQPIIDVMRALSQVFEIWIVSGRSDEVRAETERWLQAYAPFNHKLIMRKQGDYTGDDILKISWLEDGTIPKERVLCVFDDRNRVVKAWREAGLPCLQVAEGDF